MIELSQTPINESESLVVVINHDVVRFDISVHNSFRMTIIQSFQNLIDVESNIEIRKTFVKCSEIDVACIHILHDKRWSLSHWVSDNINQINDINATSQSLKNLNFSSDFGFLDRFQNLDDNSFIIQSVNSLVYF